MNKKLLKSLLFMTVFATGAYSMDELPEEFMTKMESVQHLIKEWGITELDDVEVVGNLKLAYEQKNSTPISVQEIYNAFEAISAQVREAAQAAEAEKIAEEAKRSEVSATATAVAEVPKGQMSKEQTVSHIKRLRRGRNRCQYKGESNLLIKAEYTKDWAQAFEDGYAFALTGQLMSDVIETVSLVVATMDRRLNAVVYEPDKWERKKLFSVWHQLQHLYIHELTFEQLITIHGDAKAREEKQKFDDLIQKREEFLAPYIGASENPNLRSLKINENISFDVVSQILATRNVDNQMIFLSLRELIDVYQEVAGTWATRHGDWLSSEDYMGILKGFFTSGMIEHFRVLELEESATWEEVKKAYHKLARVHHPDKDGNEEKFKEISNAYITLEDHFGKKGQ